MKKNRKIWNRSKSQHIQNQSQRYRTNAKWPQIDPKLIPHRPHIEHEKQKSVNIDNNQSFVFQYVRGRLKHTKTKTRTSETNKSINANIPPRLGSMSQNMFSSVMDMIREKTEKRPCIHEKHPCIHEMRPCIHEWFLVAHVAALWIYIYIYIYIYEYSWII